MKKILIEQKRVLIDEIYSKYCKILPESELLTLDIIECILDYIELDDSPTVKDLFGDELCNIQFVYILIGILYIYDREYRYNKDMIRLIEKINELIEKINFLKLNQLF